MIDCDLKSATLLALNFSKDILQKGTIILFDDYIFYKGDQSKGEYAALEEFKKQNPQIKFREAFEYGYGSKAFIVSELVKRHCLFILHREPWRTIYPAHFFDLHLQGKSLKSLS